MHSAVVLHVVPQLERLAAELALERPVARVHRQVRDQRRHVREALAAELAQHHAVAALVGAEPAGTTAAAAPAARERIDAAHRAEAEAARLGREHGRQLQLGHRFRRIEHLLERRPAPHPAAPMVAVVGRRQLGRRRRLGLLGGERHLRQLVPQGEVRMEQVRRLPELERLERVGEDVAGQLVLVVKRHATVHAGVHREAGDGCRHRHGRRRPSTAPRRSAAAAAPSRRLVRVRMVMMMVVRMGGMVG